MCTLTCDKCVENNSPKYDDEVVKKTCNGDQPAFGELIHRHHAACINIATLSLGDRDEAKDEVQNVLWRRPPARLYSSPAPGLRGGSTADLGCT
jgi:hypothetical protein